MKNYLRSFFLYFFIVLITKVFSQNSKRFLDSTWFFESMTTITKGKREKITILYKDNNNFESLKFKKPNILEYYVINDGFEHIGLAKWELIEENLTIISGKDTINSVLKIKDNNLSIISYDTEPGTNYGFTTIIKYKKED